MNQVDTIVGLGARSDYVAPVPHADAQRLKLTADEVVLFAAVGRASRIDEVIQRSGFEESKAIAVLLALRAKGAIVPARVNKPSAPAAPLDAATAEQVDLDEARKQEILELEGTIQGQTHFEVLGVAPTASSEEIKTAFYEKSRRFHPDRFYGKSLGSFRGRIERIYRRVSEANKILSDVDRRAQYLKEHPELSKRREPPAAAAPPRGPRTPEDDARDSERRARLSRHPYLTRTNRINELILRSKQHVAQGEFGMAYADLNLASQVDPRNAEVQTLLAEARKMHEATRSGAEMKRAAELEESRDFAGAAAAYRSAANIDTNNAQAAFKAAQCLRQIGQEPKEVKVLAQRAVELAPKVADYHALLGNVLMEIGMKKMGQKHLDLALELDPKNAEAKKHLKKGRWPF